MAEHKARLDTLPRVRRELARIYTQAREGERNVADASKLAHMLSLLGRLIEGAELEERIAKVEAALGGGKPATGRAGSR